MWLAETRVRVILFASGSNLFYRANAGFDGLAGAASVLHDEGLEGRAALSCCSSNQVLDLVALAAETHDQYRRHVGMARIAGQGTPEQVHRLAGEFHAAAGAWAKPATPSMLGIR